VNRKSTAPIAEAIAQLERQLEQFRSSQPGRTKLPESLWQAAVELARQHGVYAVADPGLHPAQATGWHCEPTTEWAQVGLHRADWTASGGFAGVRYRYIGWWAAARRRNIRFLAYNTRYLISPWVRVPHLASHILGKMTSQLSQDWERMYGHPVYFAETFIDPGRFRGTCYRAANWKLLSRTMGRGKASNSYKPNRPIKEVLGLPLTPRFHELLSQL
jgi:hypothetical protein